MGMILKDYVLGLFWGLSEVIHVKPVEQCLAHSNIQYALVITSLL